MICENDYEYIEMNKGVKVRVPKRIPTKWFWAEHRLPRILKNIMEGKFSPILFIDIFAMRRISNYWSLIRFYKNKYSDTDG